MTPDEKIRAANQLWIAVNNHHAEVGSSLHDLSLLTDAVLDDPKSDEFKAVGKTMHQATQHLAAAIGSLSSAFKEIEEIQDAVRAERRSKEK